MGCVYLWLWHFNIPFESRSLFLLVLSLITAIGFAALGYFINEYFDQQHDALAGKVNRLSSLSPSLKLGLLLAASVLAFGPWYLLPTDSFSWFLIVLQMLLLFSYSLPFPRFKSIPIVSNIVDMAYAYLVPLILSFYTYSLFSAGHVSSWGLPFIIAVILIGLRNILIHQVDDLFKDAKAGMISLPRLVGPNATGSILLLFLLFETATFTLFATMLAFKDLCLLPVLITYVAFCGFKLWRGGGKGTLAPLPLHSIRHLADPYYQWCFPILVLFATVLQEWRWVLVLPFHLMALTPIHLYRPVIIILRAFWQWILRQRPIVRAALSAIINYPIYWSFRCFGVNLKKENASALGYLRSKFTSA